MLTLNLNKATIARPTGRRTTVVVRAGPLKGLMNIFSPMDDKNDMNKVDWTGTGSGYNGSISRGRRPFKDGYMGQKLPKSQVASRQPNQEAEASIMGYLNQAVTRVVSNNFKGDKTEPDWSKLGARGWSGDVKRRRN